MGVQGQEVHECLNHGGVEERGGGEACEEPAQESVMQCIYKCFYICQMCDPLTHGLGITGAYYMQNVSGHDCCKHVAKTVLTALCVLCFVLFVLYTQSIKRIKPKKKKKKKKKKK